MNGISNNNNNDSFDINNESFAIKTHNKDIYSAVPGAFFDEKIFSYLDVEKDLNTRGRQQNFHSVTVFPYDKKTKKIDMNSFTKVPVKPFQFKGSNKIVGLLLNIEKNNAKCIEGTKANLWSNNYNVGKDNTGIAKRHQHTVFITKPKRNQSIKQFIKEEMKQYTIKKDLIKLNFNKDKLSQRVFDTNKNILLRQSNSPIKIHEENNGNTIHILNEAVYNKAVQRKKNKDTIQKDSQRMSGKKNGKMWQQYNEYVFKTDGADNQMKVEGIMLDTRKTHAIQDKNALFNNIKNVINYKQQANKKPFRVYKICNDNKVKHLKNLNEIRNSINNDFPNP